jgi:hypothetical protein
VFVYQAESYRYWEEQLGRELHVSGRFGENFTVAGLSDHEVCIGDRFRIGSALLEVTQPRVTCFKVGIRLEEPRMPALLTGHGRPGSTCACSSRATSGRATRSTRRRRPPRADGGARVGDALPARPRRGRARPRDDVTIDL